MPDATHGVPLRFCASSARSWKRNHLDASGGGGGGGGGKQSPSLLASIVNKSRPRIPWQSHPERTCTCSMECYPVARLSRTWTDDSPYELKAVTETGGPTNHVHPFLLFLNGITPPIPSPSPKRVPANSSTPGSATPRAHPLLRYSWKAPPPSSPLLHLAERAHVVYNP
ncbi:hypothetical protein BDZ89DRAFT_2671 [Hymenopellis radicata]|nr:hypothetical protein BDZ89DRAFT_2671 [Hymenopellis radicata]